MMDPVAVLLKAVREAQAELAANVKAGEHDPKATIKKLNEILATDEVLKATRELDPTAYELTLIPEADLDVETSGGA